MTHPKILVCGNHTCGNRGDAAILRGLMSALEAARPDAEFTITSRYPTSSSHILGREVVPDLFSGSRVVAPGRTVHARRRWVPWSLMAANHSPGHGARRLLAAGVRERIDRVANYDLVVQLGGSYYVDLYGHGHFETGFCAVNAGVPWILLGHSIGPISRGRYPRLMRELLQRAAFVGLRESMTQQLLEKAGMPMTNTYLGADTAWLVDPGGPETVDTARWFPEAAGRPVVAITARTLAPFDRLLGVTQPAYEAAFARLVSRLIAAGYNVLALSTCTGIESYHRDDRIVALRIGTGVADRAHYHVVMDELDDRQLGACLQQCRLLIATRLHSAIIAMNFGTPALALAYEHKSTGILNDMDLAEFNIDIHQLLDGQLEAAALAAADAHAALRSRIDAPVRAARASAQSMVNKGLQTAGL